MDGSLTIGPIALPMALLLLIAATSAGWFAGARLAARRQLDFDLPAWLVLGCAIVAARIAFVLQYGDLYAQAPLSILNLRDGGWNGIAAVAAGTASAVLVAIRRAQYARPMIAALLTGGAVWLAGAQALATLHEPARTLPPLSLTDLAGRPVAIEQFRGKPLVVNLWATWCPPCRREMPVLQQGQQRHPDVAFVFVNQRETAAKVKSFLGVQGLDLRNVLLDPAGALPAQLGERGLPTTLFIDREGRLVSSHLGELSYPTLLDRLRAIAPAAD